MQPTVHSISLVAIPNRILLFDFMKWSTDELLYLVAQIIDTTLLSYTFFLICWYLVHSKNDCLSVVRRVFISVKRIDFLLLVICAISKIVRKYGRRSLGVLTIRV